MIADAALISGRRMDFISNVWNKAASVVVPENGDQKEQPKSAAETPNSGQAANNEPVTSVSSDYYY